MKAAVLYGTDDIRYDEVDMPSVGPNQVRIRVAYCGVCGSDYPRILEGGAHYYPIILGHECAGIVDAVGEGVQHIAPGDHAAVVPLIPCMECEECRAGNYSQCGNYRFIGSRISGGYGEYVTVPAINALKIDASIPLNKAAFFEPSTVALHGVQRSGMCGGENVLVIGAGTIGLLTMQWARSRGAAGVSVLSRGTKGLEIATRLGADHVMSTGEDEYIRRTMAASPKHRGYDVVFETAGTAASIQASLKLAAPGAVVCLIGTSPSELSMDKKTWECILRKELTVVGSWMSGGIPYPGAEWRMTEKALRSGNLCIDEDMIAAVVPLAEVGGLPELMKDPGRPKGRILLEL